MSIKGIFVQVGYRREGVAKEVEDPVDLETIGFCRPCLPEGGRKKNRCLLLCMSVCPAKMNSCK